VRVADVGEPDPAAVHLPDQPLDAWLSVWGWMARRSPWPRRRLVTPSIVARR
jgi:hypothetical protein